MTLLGQQEKNRQRTTNPFDFSEGFLKDTPVFLSPDVCARFTLADYTARTVVFECSLPKCALSAVCCRGNIISLWHMSVQIEWFCHEAKNDIV